MITVEFEDSLFNEVHSHLIRQSRDEQFCFIFATEEIRREGRFISPKEVYKFSSGEDVQLSPSSVDIEIERVKDGYRAFMASEFNCLLDCHSHPFSDRNLWFSSRDDRDDLKQERTFQGGIKAYRRSKGRSDEISRYSLVFGRRNQIGRYFDPERGVFTAIDRIVVKDDYNDDRLLQQTDISLWGGGTAEASEYHSWFNWFRWDWFNPFRGYSPFGSEEDHPD